MYCQFVCEVEYNDSEFFADGILQNIFKNILFKIKMAITYTWQYIETIKLEKKSDYNKLVYPTTYEDLFN